MDQKSVLKKAMIISTIGQTADTLADIAIKNRLQIGMIFSVIKRMGSKVYNSLIMRIELRVDGRHAAFYDSELNPNQNLIVFPLEGLPNALFDLTLRSDTMAIFELNPGKRRYLKEQMKETGIESIRFCAELDGPQFTLEGGGNDFESL